MKNAVVTPSGGLTAVSIVNAGAGYVSTAAAPTVTFYTEGIIQSIAVTNGGAGYTAVPTILISDTNGVAASATASIANGQVVAITVTSKGYGYTNPTITISGGNGAGATATVNVSKTVQEDGGVLPTATATISGGAITAVSLSNSGAGYTTAPTVSFVPATGDGGSGAAATASLSGAPVLSIAIGNGGSGYVSPVVSITGGGGTGAQAIATVVSGVITAIVIQTAGTGYTTAPTVTITDSSGTGATVGTVTIGTSSISGIVITNGGVGYKATPSVIITGANTTPATVGTVTIGPSTITGVTITNAGTGISAPPFVVIGGAPLGGTNATASATIGPNGVAILNPQFYSANFINGGGVVGEWAAKYPGALGNTLKVSMADAATYSTWIYKDEFDAAPGTSDSTSAIGGSNDELHIIVIDEDGYITGVENTVLEKYAFVSKASDNKKADGQNNYYKDVINSRSEWLWWMDHTDEVVGGYDNTNWGNVMLGTTFKSMTVSLTQSLSGGGSSGLATDGQRMNAYALFSNATLYDINLIMCGKADPTVVNYVIDNVALERLDCVVYASPEDITSGEVVIGDDSTAVDKLIEYRHELGSNSYTVLDSGYKYQYDRYNDVYRWVPLNGDIAGVCARTDYTNDPWWSPGGLNRGQIKNVVRLSCNPNQTMRDNLYKNSINPVVTFPGQGTVLFGDKTLLTKPSAFDRINVRRLFIVLEKSIATAAKYQLFEFNDAFTRAQFKNLIEPFLRDVQGRRGITDFLVKCDESNNTGEVIDRNEFIADIFVKPTRSINYITLNFVAARSSINFTELGA
jgi:hypothetical protein